MEFLFILWYADIQSIFLDFKEKYGVIVNITKHSIEG